MQDLSQSQPHTKIVYVTPEKVTKDELKALLNSLYGKRMLSAFIIDEAHCISQWGHDFRLDYGTLGRLRQWYPRVPIWAVTATATDVVKKDILAQLGVTTFET